MSIEYVVHDHVARITINRPDRLNALDDAAVQELEGAWIMVEADPSVRVAVLTGSGDRSFCVGDDLKAGRSGSAVDYWLRQRPTGFGGLSLRKTIDVPVIARVNGYALGGGLELVLGCDLAVACDDAEFGFPESRVGRLPLDGAVVTLTRQLPYKWAMEILLTGRRFTASEALRFGLVNSVVPRAELDSAVDGLIEELLACAPLSLRGIKHVVKQTAHLSAEDAHRALSPAVVAALTSRDAEEGIAAFAEGRQPIWEGR